MHRMASAPQWLREYYDSGRQQPADGSSLAAYGIDPSAAVAEEAPEDGGVEESDGDDDDSDSDSDDDVKLVFTGGAQRLDLRCVNCGEYDGADQQQAATTNIQCHRHWQMGAHSDIKRTACCVSHGPEDANEGYAVLSIATADAQRLLRQTF